MEARAKWGKEKHMNELQIPKIQLDILSRTLLAAIESFYADPDNLRRYEEWLRGEDGQAYVSRQNEGVKT